MQDEFERTPQELLAESIQSENALYLKNCEINEELWGPYSEEIETDFGIGKRINIEKIEADGKMYEFQLSNLLSFQQRMNIAILEEAGREIGIIDDVALRGTEVDYMVEQYEKASKDGTVYGVRKNDPCIFNADVEPMTQDNLNPATYPKVLGQPILNDEGKPVNIAGMTVRDQVELYRQELKKQLSMSMDKTM